MLNITPPTEENEVELVFEETNDNVAAPFILKAISSPITDPSSAYLLANGKRINIPKSSGIEREDIFIYSQTQDDLQETHWLNQFSIKMGDELFEFDLEEYNDIDFTKLFANPLKYIKIINNVKADGDALQIEIKAPKKPLSTP